MLRAMDDEDSRGRRDYAILAEFYGVGAVMLASLLAVAWRLFRYYFG